MKSLLLSGILYLIPFITQAQFILPDYGKIEKEIADKNSPYYYPGLLKRYVNNDTTLAIDDYTYLYYGKLFTKESDFPSENTSNLMTKRRALFEKDKPTTEEGKQIADITLKLLENDPVNMGEMATLVNYYYSINDTVQAKKYIHQVRMLLAVVKLTGDGKSSKTAYHVSDVSDEYFMLSVLGYRLTSQSLTPEECDYIAVASNEDNVKGIYFDVKQLFVQRMKMMSGGMKNKK
jgi:hypothetical protein